MQKRDYRVAARAIASEVPDTSIVLKRWSNFGHSLSNDLRFRFEHVVGKNFIDFAFGCDDGRPSPRLIRTDTGSCFFDKITRQRQVVRTYRNVERTEAGLFVHGVNIRSRFHCVANAGQIAAIGRAEEHGIDSRASSTRRSAGTLLRPLTHDASLVAR